MRDALLGLAENPALTTELFDRLVAGGEEDVLHALAGREQLSTDQVRTLLAVGDPTLTCRLVRLGLVPWSDVPEGHPGRALDAVLGGAAPPAAWWEAAADPAAEVRQEVAYEPDAPAEVLAALADDADPRVVKSAAGNSCLPPALLPRLARHPSTAVREAVAGNENAPAALLAELLADGGHPAPTRCGACHRREAACADHAPGVRRVRLTAACHPAVPPAGLAAFLDAPEVYAVTTFAARTDLPAGFLDRLAEHPAADVRAVVAANPAVREPLLRTLASDLDPEVRRAVAENPAVPLDLLVTVASHERLPDEPVPRVEAATDAEVRSLAASRVAQVRALVADRTRLPDDLAEQLAADPDSGVARRIAARPETAPRKLAELLERHGPAVFGSVTRHPGCPAALLHRVAAHPTVGRRVLRDIARHPAASAETLLLCLVAEDPDVRRYAAAHPALPVTVLESLLQGPDETLAGAAAENQALPVTLMERIVAG
ncbi:hypothetical protein [Streptomyces sp. NK15101]|uniref:hypothetical protein n=1 Tax=Streptomyces sp. NK15101 TaxID=2873261 RepID=UPI001CED7AC1|nr:hypothetical protein [Streptomyces sp. NK15101]